DVALVEADTAVLARAEDEPPVGAEGDRGEATETRSPSPEIEVRSFAVPPPQHRCNRACSDDPAPVGAEGAPEDASELSHEQVERLAGQHVPRGLVGLAPGRQQQPPVGTEDDVCKRCPGHGQPVTNLAARRVPETGGAASPRP